MVEVMNRKGFTLIEIIVLIVMAGILIASMVVPFTTGIRQSKKPEMVATAMYLAHQQMEALMEFNYCQPGLNIGTHNSTINGNTVQWTISYVTSAANFPTSTTGDVGYKEIVVTVTDPQGSTYNVSSVVTRFSN
jgi:type II secretory pathway pseudopilin PulG